MIQNTLMAFLIMIAGYALSAGFYYMTTNRWNGYRLVGKQIVVAAIMMMVAMLLNSYPELSAVIKTMSGLDVNVENSKVGYLSLGVGLAVLVRTKTPVKK
jgi:hypothetical protein